MKINSTIIYHTLCVCVDGIAFFNSDLLEKTAK